MKIDNIDIEATIKKAQGLIREDKQLSAGAKSMFEILILIISLLANAPFEMVHHFLSHTETHQIDQDWLHLIV